MKATGFDFTWQKYAEDQKMACDIKTCTALEGRTLGQNRELRIGYARTLRTPV